MPIKPFVTASPNSSSALSRNTGFTPGHPVSRAARQKFQLHHSLAGRKRDHKPGACHFRLGEHDTITPLNL